MSSFIELMKHSLNLRQLQSNFIFLIQIEVRIIIE